MKPESISRFKKERYLKSMSEDDFRDRVVRPVFLRLGYCDGRDLCGPSEHGKDAIFLERDKLGQLFVVALQTKKGNLNLSGDVSANIVVAITQMKTALKSSVTLIKERRKVVPNKVVLCASGRINDAAKQHIISEVGNPNIQFVDSDELLPHIDTKYPELWLGIDAEILPYFNAVKRFVLGEDAAQESGHDGVLSGAADDKIFVGVNLTRSYFKKKKVSGRFIDEPEFEEFPLTAVIGKRQRKILIIGDAGSGKTTGLMRIALEVARRGIEEDKKYLIPVLMRATDISKIKPESLVSYADDVSRALAHSDKSCFTTDDLVSGRVVLLIDGLDEVSEEARRGEVLSLIGRFTSDYEECQVIISSRPKNPTKADGLLNEFSEYRMSPISWRQAEKIIATINEKKRIPKEQSQELFRRLEKIHGIELNPLLVTVFAATNDFAKQDIPANITELFKKFTELMLGRWDEKKGLRHQYQTPLKDFVLTRLAFDMHKRRVTIVSRSEAEALARSEMALRGHEANVEQMLSEIFDRSGLFRVVGDDIEFRHHLLQEFFAGRGIDSYPFIDSVVHDEWWKRALVFYFGENPSKTDVLKTAVVSLATSDPNKVFEAATTIGLALQACYLSPVADKIDIWKWVATALSQTQEKIDTGPLAAKYPMLTFLHVYLYARDSVALSHVTQNYDEIISWATNPSLFSDDREKEKLMFWFVVALIEVGDLAFAESLIEKNKIRNPMFLTAVHLGCFMAYQIRPLHASHKKIAKGIFDKLSDVVAEHRDQFMKEYGSVLVEYRNGKIHSIESEVVPGSLPDAEDEKN